MSIGRAAVASKSTDTLGFLQASTIQRRVIAALMVREALKRFGHENLGFFWIMGEPLVLTVGVMVMWSFSGTGHGHEVSIIAFALTGYTMLTLWRHLVNNSVHALRHNAGLLFHRNVRFIDILIARTLLESLGGLAAFFFAYFPLSLLGYVDTIYDPLLVITAWFLTSWFGFGFGLILAGLTELSEPAERFVQPIMYITIPLTGCFYMVNWLPAAAQNIVIWSPLVQVFEMFRGGFFGPRMQAEFNTFYIVVCCTIVTSIGLPLVRMAQKHVKMQ